MPKSGETEEKKEQKESRKKNHLYRQRFTRDELNILWRMATTTTTVAIVTTTSTSSVTTTTATATNLQTVRPHEKEGILRI